MAIVIRDAHDDDVAAMTDIYNALLESTTIEWTDEPHTVPDRLAWQREQQAAGRPVLVADADGVVVGWASYGEFRDVERWPGYAHTVEHSIHVAQGAWRQGIGRALVEALLERARRTGVHAMVAGVDGENVASIRFHQRLGFELVGSLPQVGQKHGRWLDLVFLHRLVHPLLT